jgi:O-antigen ligase
MIQSLSPSRSRLERATLWHAAIMVIAAAWMFGGRIDWARPPLILLGAIGAAITVLGLIDRRQRGAPVGRWFVFLAPPLALSFWVLIGSFNPNMQTFWYYEQEMMRPLDPVYGLPSAAVPALARSELALMLGLFLAGFNVALNTSHRRTLRQLTIILGLNACILAAFGTVQKLLGAELIFGLQASPNKSFFASFIYHNHWGPFALINIAGWFGLVEYLRRDDRGRGFFHSPAMFALLAITLLTVSLPLSTSRSATAMVILLAPIMSIWLLWRSTRSAQISRRIGVLSLGGIAILLCGIAAYWIGSDSIRDRLIDTREQIETLRGSEGIGQRGRVYSDTWQMALDRPVAGWGLESYATMYRRYSTEPKTVEGWTVQFDEAHSDWLQLLAETGFGGTLLFLLTIGIPLWSLRRRLWKDPFSGAIFLSLGILAVYAWIEFPFANPAVTVSAWVAFFTAIRNLQLSGSNSVSTLRS